MIKLIQGDCLAVMQDFEDECIDLTVTSPPYDNLRTYNGNGKFDFEGIAKQLYRVTKKGGVVVWVVGDATINGSETGTSFRQALYFKEIGFNLHDTMIYNKGTNPCHDPRNKRYKQLHEYMFVFSKGKPKTYNEICDIPVKEPGKVHKSTTHRKDDGNMRTYREFKTKDFQARGSIWSYSTGYMKTTADIYAYQHPAMFPEQLAHDHIISWSNEGDTVLDCFSGSGTTGKKAKLLNRDFIGIERDPEYFIISEKRIALAQVTP